MKTIIWKEFRELGRWVPIAVISMIAMLAYAVQTADVLLDGRGQIAFWCGWIGGVFALILGVLQGWRDSLPESRALLLHRGITPATAFLAKLAFAAMAYAIAIFVPLLGLVSYIVLDRQETLAAYPDQVVPAFVAGVLAFLFWPVGILLAQRNASLWGSRLLPLAGAIVCSIILFATTGAAQFYGLNLVMFFVWILLFLLTLKSAAIVFEDTGAESGVARAGVWWLNYVALLAFVTLAWFAPDFFASESNEVRPYYPTNQVYATLAQDGRPVLVRYSSDANGQNSVTEVALLREEGSAESDLVSVTYPDVPALDMGGTMEEPESTPDDDDPNDDSSNAHATKPAAPRGIEYNYNQLETYSLYEYEIRLTAPKHRPLSVIYRRDRPTPGNISQAEDPPQISVFDHRRREIRDYRLLADGCGQLVRRRHPSDLEFGEYPFQQHLNNGRQDANHIITSTGIFFVPQPGGEVQTIKRLPEARHERFAYGVYSLLCAYGTERELHLIEFTVPPERRDFATQLESSGYYESIVKLPRELDKHSMLKFAFDPRNANNCVALAYGNSTQAGKEISWYRFTREGKLLESSVFFEPMLALPATMEESATFYSAVIPAVAFVTSAALNLFFNTDVLAMQIESLTEQPVEWLIFAALLALHIGIAVLLTAYAAKHVRLNRTVRRKWMWTAALFGPLTSLALLTVYPRIRWDSCPNCDAKSPTSELLCQQCHEPVDSFQATGTEIFEHDQVQTAA